MSVVEEQQAETRTPRRLFRRRQMFRKRHPKVGARPGTLVISADAPAPKIRVIIYDPDTIEEIEIADASELTDAVDSGRMIWVDVQGFGDKATIQNIAEIFRLHPLALEAIVNIPQRAKCESYDEQLLLISRMARLGDDGQIVLEQVSIVLGRAYVITFQERYGDVLDPLRRRMRRRDSRIRKLGSDYLAYAIVDTIVDAYYPVLEAIGDRLESLESDVVHRPTPALLSILNRLKNRLINLRRAIWPQREAINGLVRDDHPLISDETSVFLRDTYDHCVQTTEVAEMYREIANGLVNTYLSSMANRTNEIMKVLTIMASIFIPLTFLAGIYGMNFEHMPELRVWWAYPTVWLLMGGTTVTMLAFFRRQGWIGRSKDSVKEIDDSFLS